MRLRLLLPLLLAAAGTALGAEIPISPPPLIPFYDGFLDGLIFDGSHFLLMYSTIGLEISDRNFGRTFLADDGTQLHAGVAPDYGQSGAFASSGHGYLSVAASRGNGYATRLSANGEAIDKRPFLAAPGATTMALRWDGHRYVLVWRDDGRHRLAVSFIADDGSVSGGAAVTGDFDAFALAARDGVAVVTWSFGGSAYARSITGNAISDAVPIGNGVVSDIASGNDGFLAVAIAGGAITARHLDAAGRPDASYSIPANARVARLARERYTYAIVWGEGNEVRGARLHPATGAVNGPFLVAVADEPIDGVAVAATVARTLVAYCSGPGGIFAKPIDDSGAGKPMFAHLAAQSNVHGAFNGADYVVAWQQEITASSELRIARMTLRGEPLDGAGIVLASSDQLHLEDVAAGPGVTLVVWSDAKNLWAMRVPIDATPFLLSSAGGNARAVWDGDGFTVFYAGAGVWASHIGTSATQIVPEALPFEIARSANRYLLAFEGKAFAVTSDFHLATTAVTLTAPDETPRSLRVASDGDDFLAVWDNSADQIVAQRVSSNADLIGPRIVVDAAATRKGTPHVRWDGAEWFITWPETIDATTFGFASIRIGRDGHLAGSKTIIARGPLLAGASTPFLLGWSDVPASEAFFYPRDDAPAGLNLAARIFLQRGEPARRRAAGR